MTTETVHYHADSDDLPWPGDINADCHHGTGLVAPDPFALLTDAELARMTDERQAGLREALLRIFDLAEDRPDIRAVARAALSQPSQ